MKSLQMLPVLHKPIHCKKTFAQHADCVIRTKSPGDFSSRNLCKTAFPGWEWHCHLYRMFGVTVTLCRIPTLYWSKPVQWILDGLLITQRGEFFKILTKCSLGFTFYCGSYNILECKVDMVAFLSQYHILSPFLPFAVFIFFHLFSCGPPYMWAVNYFIPF